jgi:hypothetical protein
VHVRARTEDRDAATNWATRQAQYDAVCTWGIPDHARLQRLSALDMPVFVANGDSDPMILPHYSYLLAAVYIVGYLAFSVPALIAGVGATRFGLHSTALVYAASLAALAAAAVGLLLLRPDAKPAQSPPAVRRFRGSGL